MDVDGVIEVSPSIGITRGSADLVMGFWRLLMGKGGLVRVGGRFTKTGDVHRQVEGRNHWTLHVGRSPMITGVIGQKQ